MIEFGKILREAREAKGYTISQIAEITHITSEIIGDLENEKFSNIPAPIYGRGFIKLYCETVGIDPKPLIFEYNEFCNGNRDLGIKSRPVANTPPVSPIQAIKPEETSATPMPEAEPIHADAVADKQTPPMPQPIAEEPPKLQQNDFFRLEADSLSQRPVAPKPEIFRAPVNTFGDPLPKTNPQLSRYASPLREPKTREFSFSVPPAVWRLGTLALVAIVVLYFIFAGLRALYRATSPATDNGSAEAKTAEEATSASSKSNNQTTSREKVAVPPFYID